MLLSTLFVYVDKKFPMKQIVSNYVYTVSEGLLFQRYNFSGNVWKCPMQIEYNIINKVYHVIEYIILGANWFGLLSSDDVLLIKQVFQLNLLEAYGFLHTRKSIFS